MFTICIPSMQTCNNTPLFSISWNGYFEVFFIGIIGIFQTIRALQKSWLKRCYRLLNMRVLPFFFNLVLCTDVFKCWFTWIFSSHTSSPLNVNSGTFLIHETFRILDNLKSNMKKVLFSPKFYRQIKLAIVIELNIEKIMTF